jgi:hypothetical protein
VQQYRLAPAQLADGALDRPQHGGVGYGLGGKCFKHGHGLLYGLGSHMSSSLRTDDRSISSTNGPRRIQLQ